jgi:hypothetical protein
MLVVVIWPGCLEHGIFSAHVNQLSRPVQQPDYLHCTDFNTDDSVPPERLERCTTLPWIGASGSVPRGWYGLLRDLATAGPQINARS